MMKVSLDAAARAVLALYGLEPQCHRFLDHADGLALLALLCNAAAKQDKRCYAYKSILVEAACRAAPPERWWRDWHVYARSAGWTPLDHLNAWWHARTGRYLFGSERMPIYVIATGLLLDGEPLQLSFHFSREHGHALPNIAHPPPANGRSWSGQRAQARALEIATTWLAPL